MKHCSKCRVRPQRSPQQRYCSECHAERQKTQRKTDQLRLINAALKEAFGLPLTDLDRRTLDRARS